MEYQALTDAMRILNTAMQETYQADGFVFTPAWDLLFHAKVMLGKQARIAMLGE